MKQLNLLFRIILIVVFIYSLIYKQVFHEEFIDTLNKSTLIKEKQISLLKYLLPILDVLAIYLLITKIYIGMYLSAIIMVIYTVYLIVLNNYSFYDGCSCGGIFTSLSYTKHLIVNITIIIVTIFGILTSEKNIKIDF